MNECPNVAFICSGENALELSSAICCAGKLMRTLKDEGFSVCACYSCISPGDRLSLTAKKLRHMCSVSDLVITVGCEGFRPGDVIPDITRAVVDREADFFVSALCRTELSADAHIGDFPSRAFAGFCSGALIINLPSDTDASFKRLNSLIPSIRYAVTTSKGKTAMKSNATQELLSEFFSR